MASSENEMEEQLVEAGNRLLEPPSHVDELLPLLDKVENCLMRVEQSPSKSMQNALCPLMKALVANELLRHLDMDVKVAVASCISEITRITAPDAPYDDDQMKEIFELIVSAFERLSDMSSRSYSKRVAMLETVAKVRSCVVMLDLECDALILQMFEHFLKAVRDNHPPKVFSSMETIMTLVIEESEDISVELLSPLLSCIRKENMDVLPVARKLAEKVIENCATKIKPYLVQAVRSMGISLNDYSDIVSSICQETSETNLQNDANACGDHLMDKEITPEAACPGEGPAMDRSPKSVVTNGAVQTGNYDSSMDPTSPGKKLERRHHSNQSKTTDGISKGAPESSDSLKGTKVEIKPDKTARKRGRKPNSSMRSVEASENSRIDNEKGAVELAENRHNRSKEVNVSLPEDPSIKEPPMSTDQEKETEVQLSSPATSHNETLNVVIPSPSQNEPDGSRPKKGRRGPRKKGSINEEADPGSPSVPKGSLTSDQIEEEVPPSINIISKRESEGTSDSEAKPQRRLGKKALVGSTEEDKTPSSKDVLKKDTGVSSDSRKKARNQIGKKVGVKNEDESSTKHEEGKNRRGRGKSISGMASTERLSNKKLVSSPRSGTKPSDKEDSHPEEPAKTKSKRKRTPGKEEASKLVHVDEELGETLVGSRIKVWWPDDSEYYEGVVKSFNPKQNKHKVLYVDGDVEHLNLKGEVWEFVDRETVPYEGQPTNLDGSSEMHQKKKAKTNSDSSAKQLKVNASSKRNEGALSSKSRDSTPKSVGKSKDKVTGESKDDTEKSGSSKHGSKSRDSTPKSVGKSKDKIAGESKDGPQKSGSKLQNDGIKSAGKSKDGTPKTSTKSKQDTPKTTTKSKAVTAKSASKSSANGAAKGKSGSTKDEENEDAANVKSSDAGKMQENETTGGKKRRRGLKG